MHLEFAQRILRRVYDFKKLVKLRKKRRYSQERLHRLTVEQFPPDGVSLSSIQKIELGWKPKTRSMPKLAAALGVSEDYFRLKSNGNNGKNGKRRAS